MVSFTMGEVLARVRSLGEVTRARAHVIRGVLAITAALAAWLIAGAVAASAQVVIYQGGNTVYGTVTQTATVNQTCTATTCTNVAAPRQVNVVGVSNTALVIERPAVRAVTVVPRLVAAPVGRRFVVVAAPRFVSVPSGVGGVFISQGGNTVRSTATQVVNVTQTCTATTCTNVARPVQTNTCLL